MHADPLRCENITSGQKSKLLHCRYPRWAKNQTGSGKPFISAYNNTFATGGVMPIVCGAFGEMNLHTHRLVTKCARHAAASRDNSDITPEEVSSAKGSPYNLILSQFRRSLGCLAMRAAADEKLRKVMLIRSSKAEANEAAHNAASNHRRKYNPRSLGWYDNFQHMIISINLVTLCEDSN